MSDPPVPPGPELIPCRTCQHPVARTARACPSCGAVDPWKQEADLEKERQTAQRYAKVQKGLGIGCFAFIVLWVLIGLIMMSNSNQNHDRDGRDAPANQESRARAEEWCTRKAAEAASARIPAYNPSPDEISRGHQAFMRECMKNQGY